MMLPCLYIDDAGHKGRAVYTREGIPKGTLVELSPVIVMSAEDRLLLDRTLLHDYIFLWGTDQRHCCIALGYLSLYNHDYLANCDYEMEFEEATIRITTVRDVAPGEELCINYNGPWNDPRPVWFDPRASR